VRKSSLRRACPRSSGRIWLTDRSREQMAITLCGVSRSRGRLRLWAGTGSSCPRRLCAAVIGRSRVAPDAQRYVLGYRPGRAFLRWTAHLRSPAWGCFSSTVITSELELARYLGGAYPPVHTYDSVCSAMMASRQGSGMCPNTERARCRSSDWSSGGYGSVASTRISGCSRRGAHISRQVLAFGEPYSRSA